MNKINSFFCTFWVLTVVFGLCKPAYAYDLNKIQQAALSENIPQAVINKVLVYLRDNSQTIRNTKSVAFVDFRLPSDQKRYILIDSDTGAVQKFLVAHGKNSGERFATQFSNTEDSKMSSLGMYYVETRYSGEHGISLIVEGLESTNSNARERSIVIHTADYVSEAIAQSQGRIGRSWGCFAFNYNDFTKQILSRIEGGSLMYAFH